MLDFTETQGTSSVQVQDPLSLGCSFLRVRGQNTTRKDR